MGSVKKGGLVILAGLVLAACDQTTSNQANTSNAESQAGGFREASAPECVNCGVVVSITPVTVKGEGSGAGVVLGAVVGGLLGHQVGGGSGKDAATVVGAVGGAVAGNEIEKRSRSQTYYDVTVKLDSGGTKTVSVASAASINVGTPVKVVGNNLELI